ncbi:MAG TPA: 2-oxo acid dehydrogenase subunit E2 [Verrucomicrobiota bacterium]|jgi:pyruvate/2-oxoglutarate dehydrogenase complex dihydrolipoamide acyltransferase (E2) component|nr:2-oxo acid dehydrogenase subunit E2 [Verrucomicrobiota bacterium]
MEQPLAEPVLVCLPKENTNDESAKLLVWRVATGARVTAGQALAEFETSKTTFELHAPVEGIVQYRHREGDEIAVGGFVCLVSQNGRAAFPEEQEKPEAAAQATPSVVAVGPEPLLSPSTAVSSEAAPQGQRFSAKARELLSRHGLDPAQFAKRGLVRGRDVLNSLGARAEANTTSKTETHKDQQTARITPPANVPYRTDKVSRSKRLEISLLRAAAQHTLPSAVTVACPTPGLRAAAEHAGINLSAVLVYEVARLLQRFPALNAFYTDNCRNFYQEVNIGFAFDAGQGLKVPVVRRAEAKSLKELDGELRELTVQYLNGELPVESLSGGTFTITDLAQEGATFFSPLINQCQSAILGVGAELFAPAQSPGCFHLTLAFDHQLSNGREATQFLLELSHRLAAYEQAWGALAREEPYCHHCERTLSALREIKAHLVDEVLPDGTQGRVCSLCLRGL